MAQKKTFIQVIREDFAVLVKLSVLTCIVSLPVITAGTAVLAAYSIVWKLMWDEPVELGKEFRMAFFHRIRAGILLTFVSIGLFSLWIVVLQYYLIRLEEHPIYGVMLSGAVVFGVLAASIFVYLVSVLAGSKCGLKEAVWNAILLTIAKPGRALLSVCFLGIVCVLIVWVPLHAMPFYLLFGAAGTALIVLNLTSGPIHLYLFDE
ncbi:MAG: hypothetical protein Q4F79_08170 [Eubacteriales bacterium]|nr:hypothetical protein [Eubacteriales bacterium]